MAFKPKVQAAHTLRIDKSLDLKRKSPKLGRLLGFSTDSFIYQLEVYVC